MRIRIGVSRAPKEIDIDVEDADAVVADIEKAIGTGGMLWITDTDGHRHGIVASNIVYLQVEAEKFKSVGFSFGSSG